MKRESERAITGSEDRPSYIDDYVAAYSTNPIRGIEVFAEKYMSPTLRDYNKNQLKRLLVNEFLDNYSVAKGTEDQKVKEALYWTLEFIASEDNDY